MCGSYVHGYTNWSTSAFATFTVLLVTATDRKQVHFNWLVSNSKVQGDWGDGGMGGMGGGEGATLVRSRSPQRMQTQSQQIEYSRQNNSKAVI